MSVVASAPRQTPPNDIVYPDAIPFLLVHLLALWGVVVGVRPVDLIVMVVLYFVRMFGVTAGYHRYFSHRSFKLGRLSQFLLAFLAQTSAQQGILWWAAQHRHHHRHSDTPEDLHSPKQFGFWFSHLGWIFSRSKGTADYELVKDWQRYPELVWLDRFKYLPAALLGIVVWALWGWQGLFTGFFASTVLLYHGTFSINSLAHVHGRRRFITGDDSRNNWWLALVTLGEGWHNNHHYFQSAARQGFRWWEVDPTYYVLRLLALVGIVGDLKEPPAAVRRGERRAPRQAIERSAALLVERLDVRAYAERMREAWHGLPQDLRVRLAAGEAWWREAYLRSWLPDLPDLERIRVEAKRLFPATAAGFEELVQRTYDRFHLELVRAAEVLGSTMTVPARS